MKKISLIFLSLLMLISITACSSNTVEEVQYEKVEILETDSDIVKASKEVQNDLNKYEAQDMYIFSKSRDPEGVELSETIIEDNGKELYSASDMDFVALFTEDGNYAFTYDYEIYEADNSLPKFSDDIYKEYRTILDWGIEHEDKFKYEKIIDENLNVNYVIWSEDCDFLREIYEESFGEYPYLQLIDGRYEFVYSFNSTGDLEQITWLAINEAETVTIETLTYFSTDINEGYNSLGTDVKNIWKIVEDSKKN